MSDMTSTIASVQIAKTNRVLSQLAQASRELRTTSPNTAFRLVVMRKIDRLLDEYLVLQEVLRRLPSHALTRR